VDVSDNLDEPFEDPYWKEDEPMGCRGLGDSCDKPIDISRTEIPKWAGFNDVAPVVWVATQLVSVVGAGNATVISRVVGVSRDRKALEKLAAKDHTVYIELAEMKG
jgi:hypothetical protein